jgi:CopG family nickel-responsive transcriptional regulator
MPPLVRFGVSINRDLLKSFDNFISRSDYVNRSEAFRDLIRARLIEEEVKDPDTPAYGVLTLVYNHHQRELAERLTETQHHHHHQIISTTHVHISHDLCLEVVLLQGVVKELRSIAPKLGNYKGVHDHHLTITTAKDPHD